MIIRMIIIPLRFDGGSTEEEHDIAHIASSISCPQLYCGLFFVLVCTAAAFGIVRSPFKVTWLNFVACQDAVLLHHGAQLMIGHAQQFGGAALVVFGLLQTRFH